MRALFVILAILIAGSVYAKPADGVTKRVGCWSVNDSLDFGTLAGFVGGTPYTKKADKKDTDPTEK